MTSMMDAIKPKSDQLNADDLIGGPITIKITDVNIKTGDQPISVSFDGDNGKPYKPCKSMARVMVYAWGKDSKAYVGRSMTLYREPSVKWAGIEVGGIRISHMSDIEEDTTMVLTASKGSRKPYIVRPLKTQKDENPLRDLANKIRDKIKTAPEKQDIDFILNQHKDDLEKIKAASAAAHEMIMTVAKKREDQISKPVSSCVRCGGKGQLEWTDGTESGFEPCPDCQ